MSIQDVITIFLLLGAASMCFLNVLLLNKVEKQVEILEIIVTGVLHE